jgi:biotin carboxyl carrier protein
MYKAKTGSHSFEIESNSKGIFVDGHPFSWDCVEVGKGHFHVTHDNKNYRAVIIDVDRQRKKIKVRINNCLYEIELQDRLDQMLEKLGMNSSHTGRVNSIKAPMPGLIVDLKVTDGDEVKLNDPLIVLEAMKMENIIKSPGNGTVKHVRVKKGDSVEKNQVLIEF